MRSILMLLSCLALVACGQPVSSNTLQIIDSNKASIAVPEPESPPLANWRWASDEEVCGLINDDFGVGVTATAKSEGFIIFSPVPAKMKEPIIVVFGNGEIYDGTTVLRKNGITGAYFPFIDRNLHFFDDFAASNVMVISAKSSKPGQIVSVPIVNSIGVLDSFYECVMQELKSARSQ